MRRRKWESESCKCRCTTFEEVCLGKTPGERHVAGAREGVRTGVVVRERKWGVGGISCLQETRTNNGTWPSGSGEETQRQ